MDFWIGVLAAAIAISIVFRRRKGRDRRSSPVVFWIGLTAAAIGLVGYLFFGRRF